MAGNREVPGSRDALREHFGDRKPPDITRKITACVACRKQKIKCHMPAFRPPCDRCKRRKLSCTVNKSLQMLLEDDADWRGATQQRLECLQTVVETIAQQLSMPELVDKLGELVTLPVPMPREAMEDADVHAPERPSSADSHRSWDLHVDAAGGPAAIPGSHMSEKPAGQLQSHQSRRSDLVSKNIVSLQTAEELFRTYQQKLDHYVYRILDDQQTFSTVRANSPILLAAVCAVAALHLASNDFDVCLQEYIYLCSQHAFAKRTTTDDVRAYCVGAFWLSEYSWSLAASAVRAATEIQLHRSIFKALEGDKASYWKTRLFYLVYTCDHHFSIAYGRPPMTRECESITAASKFTSSLHATQDDARLVSQVQIWAIGSRVFQTFGTNVDTPVPLSLLPQVRRFAIDLDIWRADWNERFTQNAYVGNYPRKGVGLHFHFAKLYLSSHVFRGRSASTAHFTSEMDEIASAGIVSASSILNTIISDPEIRSHLYGLPTYFITMITFATIFLLNLATKYPHISYLHKDEVLGLIGRIVTTLEEVCAKMHPRHLLVSISKSLTRIQTKLPQSPSQLFVGAGSTPTAGSNLMSTVPQWLTSPSDIALWENYDFLSYQDFDYNFDFNLPNPALS